jgi:CSLREA domain-containing protein
VLAGGSTFDVTGLTTSLTLASGQGLKATGSGSSGTIATSATKGLATASNSTLNFTAYDGSVAPLTISGVGTVALQSTNTVNVTKTGLPLGAGDYVLISKGTGSVTGTAPSNVSVSNLAPGMTASSQITGQQLVLHVGLTLPNYRSKQSGNWNDFNTWQVDAGLGFVNAIAGQTPTSADGTITIQSPHIVTVTASVNADQLTVNTGGLLLVNTGVTFTIADGSGTDLSIDGIVGTAGTLTNNGQAQVNGTLRIDQGGFAGITGTYTYNQTTGTLIFNNTSGSFGVNSNHTFWPGTNGPQNVAVGSGGITMNVARTVGLTFETSSQVQNAGNLTFNGLFTIFTGGSVSGSPTYGPASTLRYATGGTYGRAGEWLAVTSGAGYPANVQVSANTTLDIANGPTFNTAPSQIAGNLTIDAGSTLTMAAITQPLTILGNITNNGTLSLSTALGGDIHTQGNWTDAGTFTPNGRAVFFDGAAATQTIAKSSGETFDYLVINKTAGSVKLLSNVTVGATVGNVLQLLGGTLDLNGNTLSLTNSGGNILASGGARSIDSTGATGFVSFQGSKTISGASGGTLTFGNVNASLGAGVDFGAGVSTINSSLSINAGGAVINNAPTYGATSNLLYNSGGNYGRGAEWTSTTSSTFPSPGYPHNVTVGNGTVLDVGANGGTATSFAADGTLSVLSGSTFTMGATPMTVPVSIKGDVNNAGIVTFSAVAGADLKLQGSLLNQNGGTYGFNNRAVFFEGAATQNITDFGGAISIPYVVINKSGGTVNLNGTDLSALAPAGGNSISFQTATSTLTLNARTLTLGGIIGSAPAGAGLIGNGSASIILNDGGATGDMGTLPFASSPSLNNLTVNRTTPAGNVTLGTSVNVFGTLTLTAGTVTTGANTLSLGGAATATRATGYVVGTLQKSFSDPGSFTFHVGTTGGYSPVDANSTTGTGTLSVRPTETKQPNIAGTNALSRFWTLSGSGITTNLTFHYLAGDVNVTAPVTEADYKIIKFEGNAFTSFAPTALDTTNHTATLNGVSSFSDWTLAADSSVFGSLQFSASDYPDAEDNAGTHTKTITVTRTGGTSGAISVHYATSAGSATTGSDYVETSGDLNWANADATDKTFDVTINGDTTFEPDETVNLTLSSPTGGATLGTPSTATLTITNDDTAPALSIANGGPQNEGNSSQSNMDFIVTLSPASGQSASVQYATADILGGATGGAACGAGVDYVTTGGTLNFDAGETQKTISVPVCGDTDDETDETFNVTLSSPSGATISNATATGTITNDDSQQPPPAIVYVDDDWAGTTPGADPDGAGPATSFGFDAFATVQDGVGGVATGGTVNVLAGTYDEDVAISNDGLQLLGAGAGSVILQGAIGGDGSTIHVLASNVTIAGMTITRLGNNTTDWNNSGLNSAGIAIQGTAITGTLIRDNIVTGNRTGLDINNTNGHTVRNNVIDFNRTGMILRNQTDNMTFVENFVTNNWTVGVLFLDASGGTNVPAQSFASSAFNNNDISLNWYGQVVDRQTGGSLPAPNTTNLKNFRGNWLGTTSPVVTTANSAEPGYAAQIPVAYGGTATPPGGQPDIAGPASANIKFIPFLQSGTDTNVETTPGRGTNGFQGVTNAITVLPSSLNGWVRTTSGTATTNFVHGPATPPLGVGSGELSVGSDGDSGAQFRQTLYNGTLLSDVTALTYSTYTSIDTTAPPIGDQTIYIILNIDKDGNGTLDTLLFFEPEFQHGYTTAVPDQGDNVLNTWQTWDARVGGWYAINSADGNPVFAGAGSNVEPLDNFNAAFPAARINNSATTGSVRLVAGFGAGSWDNFVGNVDNFQISINAAKTIYDFEPLPRLSIDDVTHNEGNSGTTDYTFNVTLSRAISQTVTVDVATADSTATAPSDYTSVPVTQLVFNPGETSKPVTVVVNGDNAVEPDEQFFVNLSNVNANAEILDAQGVGTITNDDAEFSIDDVTLAEGNAGQTSFTFTVTKTGASGFATSVDFATSDGTAKIANNDYASNSGTLNFGPTDTTKTITVLVNGDTTPEPNETFFVNLSNPVGATILDAQGKGLITNDDGPPSVVYVDDDWAAVPNGTDPDGAGPATEMGFDAFSTIQGGVSGVASGGTVNVAAGTYTENVNIPQPLTLKGAQFGVDARGRVASESTVSPATASIPTFTVAFNGTITIDGFSFSGGSSPAGGGGGGVIVTTVGPNNNMQIVNNRFIGYSTAAVNMNRGGTNITIDKNVMDGSDITGNGQTIFANGTQNFDGLFITNNDIINNAGRYGFFVDGNHNVGESATRAPLIGGNLFNKNLQALNLGSRSFGEQGTPALGAYGGFITNNTFSNHTANGIQAGIQHVLVKGNTFTGNALSGLALTSFGNAGTDRGAQNSDIISNTFTGNGGTTNEAIFFSAGQAAGTISTNHAHFNRIVGNFKGTTYNGTETIDVENNWWGCNAGPGQPGCDTVTGTGAANTDFNPWLVLGVSASPNPIIPGGTSTVTADLTHNSDGAQPSATDFIPPTPVTFSATEGNVSPTSSTLVNGQATTTFTSTSASNGTASATVDNETETTTITVTPPSFTIDDVTLSEGNAGQTSFTFTVTRNGGTNLSSSVDFVTADGTATVAGGDYASNSGTLIFAANETTKPVTVLVTGDTIYETNETFFVNLSNPSSATIGDAQGKGTITNDDAAPTLAIDDVTQAEGDAGTSTFTFTVTRTGATEVAASVSFATADDTAQDDVPATEDNDYQPTSGTLNFAANETTKQIAVTVNGDVFFEANETFFVNLSNPVDAAFGDAQGVGTITNDDPPPVLTIDDATHAEGNTGTTSYTFTVTKTGPTNLPASVDFTTQDGTATTANNDYQLNSGTLNFAADETTKTITVLVNGDTVYEGNETFTVVLSNPSNATISDGTGLGTINNDDNPPATLVVNTTNDADDGFCLADHCSLREAINAANLVTDLNTINFQIPISDAGRNPTTGVFTITPATQLPTITRRVTINGYTQPGATTNTLAVGDNAVLLIELNGTSAGASAVGLDVNDPAQPAVTVRGLVINRFGSHGIRTQVGGSHTFAGNFIGTNAAGTAPLPNGGSGIAVISGSGNTIGGANPAARNVISGNASRGVQLGGGANTVQGNYIGTNASGTADLGNTSSGVSLSSSTSATIGGFGTGEGNLISGNDADGVAIAAGNSNIVQGNRIGTQANGSTALGNGANGISLSNGTVFNTIGGIAGSEGNTIAFNGGDGVHFSLNAGVGNSIRGNSIFSNGATFAELGIDLGEDGTSNDAKDPDTGPNNLQNFPVINSATTTGTTKTITGNLNSTPGQAFSIDFYSNPSCDTSGSGEGKTYIGTATPGTTNGNGDVTFIFHPASLSAGEVITSTATDASGNTSEFSQCFAVAGGSAGEIQFSSPTYTVAENVAGQLAAITLTRVGGSDGSITATFSTSDGTATGGQDYSPITSTVTFGEGETSKTVNIAIINDSTFEGDETVNLSLTTSTILGPVTNITAPNGRTATLTITDAADAPVFSISDAGPQAEGNAGQTTLTFTITKTGTASVDSSISYSTSDGTATTADGDYVALPPTLLTFAPNETSKQVSVTINGDTTPELDENFFVTLTATASGAVGDGSGTGTIANDDESVSAGQLIISEFRLRGPGNAPVNAASDEFIELYNNTDSPLLVTTTDGSAGWALAASDGVARFLVPVGTTIPARGHFLGANTTGYSLASYPSGNDGALATTATPDATYTTDIPDNVGIALFRSATAFTSATRLDSVGSTSEANTLYKEGAGYPALLPADIALNLQHSFYRSLCSFVATVGCTTPGIPKDSDDNASDFLFVDTSGTSTAAGHRLGAPGPENLTSPVQSNSQFSFLPLDRTKGTTVAPNRVRDFGSDPMNNSTFGTISIRRRVTNTTGSPVTRLRFRVIEVTTFPAPPGTADMRVRTSSDTTVTGIDDAGTCSASGAGPPPCGVTVRGTILETPPAQPSGGGNNSSVGVGNITLAAPLAPGESINIHFLLGIQQTGTFRFLINIEAVTNGAPVASPASQTVPQ